jgi:hypothetical protein
MRPIQQYPWQTLAILAVVAALLEWSQWRRDNTQPSESSSPAILVSPRQATRLSPAEQASVRRQLLNQVRRIWVEGVLDRSLAQVAHIDLSLSTQPDAITHLWGTLLHQVGEPDEELAPGTRISEIADRFHQHLLILGAPGAGKTTLLLEYARDLLDEADRDPTAPLPVVFHLSSWPASEPRLVEWLADELALRYGVSRRLTGDLVDRDLLALLLDGLDEIPADRREAAVQALNAFRADHGHVPLAVCARSREYHELATQLTLSGAVEVQPLDRLQVRRWLTAAGRPLAGLRAALRNNRHWLWELLDNPLLLSIAALAYKGQPSRVIRADGSAEVLFGAYVDAMLARPRAPLAPVHWLWA